MDGKKGERSLGTRIWCGLQSGPKFPVAWSRHIPVCTSCSVASGSSESKWRAQEMKRLGKEKNTNIKEMQLLRIKDLLWSSCHHQTLWMICINLSYIMKFGLFLFCFPHLFLFWMISIDPVDLVVLGMEWQGNYRPRVRSRQKCRVALTLNTHVAPFTLLCSHNMI